MSKLILFLRRFWPVGILCLLSLFLFLTNYQPGTYLLGWDSTTPELNLPLNFWRFLFGVWQEYRGLGTLDGMAHTANIVYWFYTAAFSLILPQNLIRYATNLGTHLVGGLGLFWLLRFDLLPELLKLRHQKTDHFQQRLNWIAFLAANWYMLNLMTVQMFYTPLELFSLHFAILPWGIYAIRRYFRLGTPSALFVLFLVNLAGVSQAHVPTIFIPYALIISIFFAAQLFIKTHQKWRKLFLAGAILISVNAFWGLPYAYSALHKSAEISQAKQNRMGTDGAFYRNLAWGDLHSLATYGGFQLDYIDWHIDQQKFGSILEEWLSLYHQPYYQVITITISVMSGLGFLTVLYLALRQRSASLTAVLATGSFAFVMLGTNVPGINQLSAIGRKVIPFFYQIFRFTFTKFSLLYVCCVALFLGYFLAIVFCQHSFAKIRTGIFIVTIFALTVGIGLVSQPAFQGFFFYPALRVNLPSEYETLVNQVNTQDQITRIATFPIHSFWGWITGTASWGYRGSGFLWQMFATPLVDRSFDGWSKENETEFFQLSNALYSLDSTALLKTFDKYFTNGIFWDKNTFNPGNYPQALFTDETQQLFQQLPEISLAAQQGKLELYKVANSEDSLWPSIATQAAILNPNYKQIYTFRDQAFLDHGQYLMRPTMNSMTQTDNITYPFSDLQSDELHQLSYYQPTQNVFTFSLPDQAQQRITLPSLTQTERSLPLKITTFQTASDSAVHVSYQLFLPTVHFQDGSTLSIASASGELTVPAQKNQQYNLGVGSELLHTILDQSTTTLIHLPLTGKPLSLGIYQKQPQGKILIDKPLKVIEVNGAALATQFDQQLKTHSLSQAQITLPGTNLLTDLVSRSTGAKNCKFPIEEGQADRQVANDSITYTAKGKAAFCDSFVLPEYDPFQEYLLFLKGKTVSGGGMYVSILNSETKHIDTLTTTGNNSYTLWLPIFPSHTTHRTDELSQLTFTGEAYGPEANQVQLNDIRLYYLPLKWLTQIYLDSPNAYQSYKGQVPLSHKVGTTFYSSQVQVSSSQALLRLPQSFDAGWIAFKKPSTIAQWLSLHQHLFEHVQYNGWANGWLIPTGEYIVYIWYWPQLLSFVGYGVLAVTLLGFLGSWVVSKKRRTA